MQKAVATAWLWQGLRRGVIALLLTLAFSGQALATEAVQLYRVTPGDTLWLLSQRYGSTIKDVKQLSGMPGDQLEVGQPLYLPVALEQSGVRYRVTAGDTLYLISQRVNRPLEAITESSDLSSDLLYPGQTLFLPAARPAYQAHVVGSGESLYKLAQKYQTTVADLKRINFLPGEELLAGQILEVPRPAPAPAPAPAPKPDPTPAPDPQPVPPPVVELPVHRVASGQTLSDIALRYGTTAAAIFQTNRLNSDILMPGQPLYIPPGKKSVEVAGPQGSQKTGFGEFLEWEWARWVYNVGAVATVIDWQTGQKFTIRHMGGSNHADSEPLTAADTKIMKQIFGGEWNWTKRPILLQVGDRTLAASIAGMPHSVQTIYDNKFPGHFDLYFYNSLGHADPKPDPQHQANIRITAGLN